MKSRFCPSPTGLMHLGNTRTALFNALLATNEKGIFLLRIEDTDKLRSEQEYVDVLMRDLLWLGLSWQEGPGKDEYNNGPYWQSQRQAVYDQYYELLQAEGLAYPCFCSEEQLALTRKIQLSTGRPPRYSGVCRELSKDEISERLAAGLKPTLRFRVPENHEIVFHDLIRGEQKFNGNDIGDFIIRRADGTSSFIFCNAIDDALMKVTHALRGEDHLTNTPRQIMILRALGLPEPNYGHMSLILGSDGNPLSKRNGSRSLRELREHGFLPIAVVNYLARLGHHYLQDEFLNFSELAAHFKIAAISHAPARFDNSHLLYWQKQAVQKISNDDFVTWLADHPDVKLIPEEHLPLFIEMMKANVLFPQEVYEWIKVLFSDDFFYDESCKSILKDSGIIFWEKALAIIAKHGNNYHTFVNALRDELSINGKALFKPLRISLTGREDGLELANIFKLLSVERINYRFNLAKGLFHL